MNPCLTTACSALPLRVADVRGMSLRCNPLGNAASHACRTRARQPKDRRPGCEQDSHIRTPGGEDMDMEIRALIRRGVTDESCRRVRQVLDQPSGALDDDPLGEDEVRALTEILKPAAERARHDHPDAAKVEQN